MTLITGANGHLGGLTIDFLQAAHPAVKLAALVRSDIKGDSLKSKGVEIRIGDYSDKDSLEQAVKGMDTVLLISSGSLEGRVQQHANVIDAAKSAGVKHIVYTSVVKPSPDSKFLPGIDHYHTEKLLVESGLKYTILRDTFYFEVFPMFLANSLKTGEWYFPSNGSKMNLASRVDMAEAIAAVVADPSAHENKVYDLATAKSYSLAEIGAFISEATGKTFTYNDVPAEAYRAGLVEAGVPAEQIPMIAGIAEAIALGELDQPSVDLEKLIGHEPKTLKSFINELVRATV